MKTRRTAFALALVASALLAHQATAARIAPIQRPVDDITDVRLALAELEQDPEVLFETFVSIHGRERVIKEVDVTLIVLVIYNKNSNSIFIAISTI